MRELWLYRYLSRFGILSYRAKIMVVAFLGTHVPLLALAAYFALQAAQGWRIFLAEMVVVLLATLAGTGLTLFVLHHLLRPVTLVSTALRRYRESRQVTPLPEGYGDEVGTLMADTATTIDHLERTLDVLENIDEATGLPNRRKFVAATAELIRRRQPFAVAVLRAANHARIADALSPRQADAAMRELAGRVCDRIGRPELLARVSDAELAFPIFHRPGAEDPWLDLSARMRALLQACSGELVLDSISVSPAMHCGIAAFPDDAESAEALLDHAVAAASLAVDGAPVILHSPDTRQKALERFRLEQDLRHAMERNEFALHYQPIVDLAQGRAIGGEALLRWNHPVRGTVSPGLFIPAAEESGLIDHIGLWVLREACRQTSEWKQAGRPGLHVAVNLSARQFLDPELKQHIVEAVEGSGIEPDQLEIELTETAAMADHERTRHVLGMLRDLGVRIVVDDFGTGYASMSYLRKLPFDKLKIDREFVQNVHELPESQAICGAVLALAGGLGLEVLAEGTETEEEVRYLRSRGCALFQGFYFGRPQPAAEFAEMLDDLKLSERLRPAVDPATGAIRDAG